MTAAQLAMATDAMHSVSLDEAIEAMRLTAADMSIKYKETSLSVSIMVVRSYCVFTRIRQGLAVRFSVC
jgi:hypothetical protein